MEKGESGYVTASAADTVLEFEQVNFGYGQELVLEEFSLGVSRRDFLGVIGPNGAGKTTLLRLAAGLVRPASGTVRLCGKNLAEYSRRAVARKVAVVFQENHFAFDYRVKDVVLMGRHPHVGRFASLRRQDYEIASAALQFVDADHLEDKKINQISAGEKQRVVLARALAQEPEVLLLDEATSHLDLSHQLLLLELLQKLNREEGRTVIFLAHDLNLAALVCNKILLLAAGRKITCDTPERVLTEEIINRVYGVKPVVIRHPLLGVPQVILPAKK